MFEAGSTTEMTVELRVEPDDIFETNETYILTRPFVPRSIRERQNLELLDTLPVVTIVNDDSKFYFVCVLHHNLYIFTFSLFNSNSVSQMLQ